MNDSSKHAIAPWYKQPWLWFILAPLFAVAIYGSFFLYMAITTSDGIVKEDYYKVARGHFVDSTKENEAIKLGISGVLQLDNLTGDLMFIMNSSVQNKPEGLTLYIVSPTHEKYDQSIQLKQVPHSDAYTGSLKAGLKGKRYILLESTDGSWRLRTETYPPYDQKAIELKPSAQ